MQVISRKDQAQYWSSTDIPYSYISVDHFSDKFKLSHIGERSDRELSVPCQKTQSDDGALSFSTYSLSKRDLFKACMAREWLLMKRNRFVYIFKTVQVITYLSGMFLPLYWSLAFHNSNTPFSYSL